MWLVFWWLLLLAWFGVCFLVVLLLLLFSVDARGEKSVRGPRETIALNRVGTALTATT